MPAPKAAPEASSTGSSSESSSESSTASSSTASSAVAEASDEVQCADDDDCLVFEPPEEVRPAKRPLDQVDESEGTRARN